MCTNALHVHLSEAKKNEVAWTCDKDGGWSLTTLCTMNYSMKQNQEAALTCDLKIWI